MKKLLLILLCLPIMTLAQQTYVPNDNFELTLIDLGYDNVLDDYVQTSNINTVTSLNVMNQNIANLTGIEDFTALDTLFCAVNLLTSLDISNNTALAWLKCDMNQLTSLDVSQNTALTILECFNNLLTSLDVSNNTALFSLKHYNNQLVTLDVRNGNNTNLISFVGFQNPNLTCISVDDANWSTSNWVLFIDPQHYFSNNCSGTAIGEHTTNKKLLRTIDVLGRETKNKPLFYIYDDGSVENKIILE